MKSSQSSQAVVVKKKKNTISNSVDTSPDGTPRNSARNQLKPPSNSPRGTRPECKLCNYKAPEKVKKGFFKNAFKKTMSKIMQMDNVSPQQPQPATDTLAEYHDTPGSNDMIPVPQLQKNDERLKNKTFKKDGSVFSMNRPWWTIREMTDVIETPRIEPFALGELEAIYLRDRQAFLKPVKRTTFYDPLSEDLDTLKSLDNIHNAHNVLMSNTFFTGVNQAMAAQKSRTKSLDSGAKVLPAQTSRVVRFADPPFFMHQYDRKDHLSGGRRIFTHVERVRRTSKEPTPARTPRPRGLVFD